MPFPAMRVALHDADATYAPETSEERVEPVVDKVSSAASAAGDSERSS